MGILVTCYFSTLTNQHYIIIMSAAAAAPKKAAAEKAKTPANHPKYSEMIAAAITTLKDRTGSSRQAILKYICANHKVDAAKAPQHLRIALKGGVANGKLKMAKATGKGAGSFKIGEKAKKEKKPAAKKAKKPAAKKAKKPFFAAGFLAF